MSGDGGAVLPWLLIRQDAHGNRYRVGSYATRAEAQEAADLLGGSEEHGGHGGRGRAGGDAREEGDTPGSCGDGYLVVPRDGRPGPRG